MLEVQKIGKRYGKRSVVRKVNLSLSKGEVVGLLGPNGAGKTTCFYMISGLIKPDYGQISLNGVEITNLPMYRRAQLGVGYLPQESSVFRGLTVGENIEAVLEAVEPIESEREKRLEELLAEFSITHLKNILSINLSGGERRRLEIARALAVNPEYILLDEPLAGIDPIAIADIKNLIYHLKDKNIGVLITDHNVREMLDIVDRTYIIYDGEVLIEGDKEEIISHEVVRRVYLGDVFNIK
ncbi:MAG: LPS export ABC transporter ATP-binding protein [Rickettsiales bacterium]|jgi:lipopolysaccharide export system ATP-binding protein|nr:LPS export ABC transporter ATP-binding protein [Rickettsiales bacterium]